MNKSKKVNVLEALVDAPNLMYVENFNNENSTLAAVTDENCNIGFELYDDAAGTVMTVLSKLVYDADDIILDVNTEIVLTYSVRLSDEQRNKYYELIKPYIEKLRTYILLDERNLTFVKDEYTMV